MLFFGKKKNEEDLKKIKEVAEERKTPEEIRKIADMREIEEIKPKKEVEEVAPTKEEVPIPKLTEVVKEKTFAPLFVKIDRYRSLLDTIKDIKTMIIMMKNALGVQKQIEGMRNENRKFLETAIDKIDKKILLLDSDFLRPRGYEEEFTPPIHKTESLEGVVEDLKKQIEGLKSELKTIS